MRHGPDALTRLTTTNHAHTHAHAYAQGTSSSLLSRWPAARQSRRLQTATSCDCPRCRWRRVRRVHQTSNNSATRSSCSMATCPSTPAPLLGSWYSPAWNSSALCVRVCVCVCVRACVYVVWMLVCVARACVCGVLFVWSVCTRGHSIARMLATRWTHRGWHAWCRVYFVWTSCASLSQC